MSSKIDYLLETQKALKAAGFYAGALDGKWGPGSHKAVTDAIQKAKPTPVVIKPVVTSTPAKDGYEITVRRFKQSANTTISEFSCNWNKVKGYMLEPAGPATIVPNRNRRIPAGVYNLRAHSGARYKRVVNLYNDQVPASRAILIHQGNTAKDTVGCLIIGTTYGADFVGNSMVKLTELMNEIYKVGADKVKLKIVEDFK